MREMYWLAVPYAALYVDAIGAYSDLIRSLQIYGSWHKQMEGSLLSTSASSLANLYSCS